MLTAEQARELFNYDPETGVITWRSPQSPRMKVGDISGTRDDRGYWKVESNAKRYKAHRLAWLITHGKWPDGQIDHINGDPSDNRIANLRDVTHQQNCFNRKSHKNNSSGSPGVHFHKPKKKWQARICVRGKRRSLGLFVSKEDAIRARKKAEQDYFGDYRRGA